MNELIYFWRHVLIYQKTPGVIYALSPSNFQTSKDQGDCQKASGTHALAINDDISTSLGYAAYLTVHSLCGRNKGSFPVGGFVSLPHTCSFVSEHFIIFVIVMIQL